MHYVFVPVLMCDKQETVASLAHAIYKLEWFFASFFPLSSLDFRAKTMVSLFLADQLGPTTATSAISLTFYLTILTLSSKRLTILTRQIK